MPEIEVEIEVYCDCGAGLCGTTVVTRKHGRDAFVVSPCDACLEGARIEGYEEGDKDARATGEEES